MPTITIDIYWGRAMCQTIFRALYVPYQNLLRTFKKKKLWENRGTERLSNFPQVAWAVLLPNPGPYLLPSTASPRDTSAWYVSARISIKRQSRGAQSSVEDREFRSSRPDFQRCPLVTGHSRLVPQAAAPHHQEISSCHNGVHTFPLCRLS